MADNMNLDSLLDATLDDLADLPEFAIFHPGAHRVSVEFSVKEINKKPAVEMKMKLLETLELADPDQVPQAPGTETSIAFMLENEFGQGNLKKIMAPLAEAFGTSSLRDTMNAAKGTECNVVSSTRADKLDKDRLYMQIKSLEVA